MDSKSSIKIDIDNIEPSPFEILERKITDKFGDSYEIIYEIIGQYNDILQENYANQKIIKNDSGIFVKLGAINNPSQKIDQKYYDEAEKFKQITLIYMKKQIIRLLCFQLFMKK